jgi:hypothetical protein
MSAEMGEPGSKFRSADDEIGEWITPPVSYVDPSRRFCAFCGRPIARRYWQVKEGVERLTFCDPAHAPRRTTYPNKITNGQS